MYPGQGVIRPQIQPATVRLTEEAEFHRTVLPHRGKFVNFINNFKNWINLKPAMKGISSKIKQCINWKNSIGIARIRNSNNLYMQQLRIANQKLQYAITTIRDRPSDYTNEQRIAALLDAVIATARLIPKATARCHANSQLSYQLADRLGEIARDLDNKYP